MKHYWVPSHNFRLSNYAASSTEVCELVLNSEKPNVISPIIVTLQVLPEFIQVAFAKLNNAIGQMPNILLVRDMVMHQYKVTSSYDLLRLLLVQHRNR